MAFLDDTPGSIRRVTIGAKDGDAIMLDASLREDHGPEGDFSDHPVEAGADIVDHFRVRPEQVRIEGVISDSPIVQGIPGPTLVNSVSSLLDGDTRPSLNAWSEFRRFFANVELVTIATSLHRYENMAIVSLKVVRDAKRAHSLYFTIAAREVRFARTSTGVAVEVPKEPEGQKTKSVGKVTNKAANAGESKKTSAAVKVFQGLGVID